MTRLHLRRASALAFLVSVASTLAAQPQQHSGFVPLRGDATTAPLGTPVSIAVSARPLVEVIEMIARQGGLSIVYDRSLPALAKQVTVRAERITAAAALVRALDDSGLEAMVSATGQVVIVPRSPSRRRSEATVRGSVRDAMTSAPVAGARIELLGTPYAATTRDDGTFVVGRVPPGEYAARVTQLGFRPVVVDRVDVDAAEDVALAVGMERVAIPLEAVLVTPGYFGVMTSGVATSVAMTRHQIETVPQIGEDIYRAMNRLPGVTAGDFSSRLFVRGGSDEELYVTLDGLELIEPFHLKDFEGGLSILDSKAIRSVELTTGGFAAEYGDRLTGVLTMRSVDPRTDRTRTSLGLSLMNARVTSQGGFAGGRGGWLFSARSGYLDIAIKLAQADDSLSPRYYDVFSKVQYDLPSGGRLAAHVLHADDHLRFLDFPDPSIRSHYGSSYGWVTWDDRFGARLRQRTVASIGRLTWSRDGESFDRGGTQTLFVDDRRSLDAAALRQDWSLDLTSWALLKWGADARQRSAEYDYHRWMRQLSLNEQRERVASYDTILVRAAPSGTALGGYVAPRIRLGKGLVSEVGLRYDRASHTEDEIVSPRVNVSWEAAKHTTIRAAWGRYSQSQAIHALQALDGVDRFFPAERAEQRVLGVERALPGGVVARAEIYDRRLSELRPAFINVGSGIEAFPEVNWARVRLDATSGRSRGTELFVSRGGGRRMDWAMSYALARAEDVIDGRTVPRRVDQRHTVQTDWAYHPASNKWRLTVAALWHTGWPYTPQVVTVDTIANTPTEFDLFTQWSPGPINSARLPSYRRMDVRWTRYFEVGRSRLSMFAEVFNLLNTENPRGFYTNVNVNNRRVTLQRGASAQIGRLPVAGFSWEF